MSKLIEKYSLHLKHTNLTTDQLLALPWKTNVIETSTEFTSARVSIVDDRILVKTPTNNAFINTMAKSYAWNKKDKSYVIPCSTTDLKFVHQILPKYFKEVRYCDKIKKLMEPLSEYSKELIWDPTYTKINNNYYVVAANMALYGQINNLVFDTDPQTLFKLSQMGIKVSEDLIETDYQRFAAEYSTTVDADNILTMIEWLKQLGVDSVLVGPGVRTTFVRTRDIFIPMFDKLAEANISCHTFLDSRNHAKNATVLIQYYTTYMSNDEYLAAKRILIKNSRPIEVK
jgi:hypothetical protein